MYMNKSFSFDEALELSKACVFSSTQNVESAWNAGFFLIYLNILGPFPLLSLLTGGL